MQVVGAPDPALVDTIRRLSEGWATLERAVQWALDAGAEVDVIAMDEYSHDVRMALSGGCVVLEST